MRKWQVHDRAGNEIYLTEERWQHIIERHGELRGRRREVLETIRKGRRRQNALLPYKYTYTRLCYSLPGGYNRVVVTVVFREGNNNFVVTAWPDFGPER